MSANLSLTCHCEPLKWRGNPQRQREFALMQTRGIATNQTQNFALGIAVQGVEPCTR